MDNLAYKDELSGGNAVNAQNSLQLIAFSIGEQTYGVEITTVREIRAWNGATPLPNTREFVRGVINLRGTIVPIFDLRARFGDGQTEAQAALDSRLRGNDVTGWGVPVRKPRS